MKAGGAFHIQNRDVDSHLWVVVSDPDRDPERVVMVSMTTYEDYKEDAYLLDAGDHPRVSRKTCIAYNEARMTTLEHLNALSAKGRLVVRDPVSPEVLKRIRDGASRSRNIKYKFIEILIEQEVIE